MLLLFTSDVFCFLVVEHKPPVIIIVAIIIIIKHLNLQPFHDKMQGVKIGRPQTQMGRIVPFSTRRQELGGTLHNSIIYLFIYGAAFH